MAKHKVDIHARGPRMKASRTANGVDVSGDTAHSRGVSIEDQNDAVGGVFGLQFKPVLSEPVLRAVGLHGGKVPKRDAPDADAETVEAHERARALHVAHHGSGSPRSVIRDLRDTEGAIYTPPPESPDECRSAADAILYASHKYGGYFERTPITDDDGDETGVAVRFTYGPTADVVTGSGATTKDAVRAMFAKLDESFACLEPKRASRSADEGDDNE